jgi:hypothetical protein
VARVVALIPDLLFGSRVQGALVAAGHEVELAGDAQRVRERLRPATPASGPAEPSPPPAVLVVDLTGDLDGARIVEELLVEGTLAGTRTLGFYSHVDVEVRRRAEQAGIELVVPRSRMAREGAELVGRLAASLSG